MQSNPVVVKLSFDCGFCESLSCGTKATEYQRQDDCITASVANGGGAYESRSRERLTQWIYVSQRIDDYLWQKSSGTLLSVEELRYLMRQPFYLAGFHHPLRGNGSYRHSAKQGGTQQVTEMLSIQAR